jgi:hypothetical protein
VHKTCLKNNMEVCGGGDEGVERRSRMKLYPFEESASLQQGREIC